MKFYFWTNNGDGVGDYDIFCETNEEEKQIIVKHFNNVMAESVYFEDESQKKFFYLLNINKKTITPLSKLSYAFGGQYNAWAPVGYEYEKQTGAACL